MKVVFDTNVLLSATLWYESEAQKLLFELIKADFTIYSSVEILSEYKKVLKRDFNYTHEEIGSILETVLATLILVEPIEKIYVVKDDPEDNKIIECALAANADCIISYDAHLLKLEEYRGIKIVLPKVVRRELSL
ncbi:putative toxin-antitoxin system toxin component, PIN family [Candidatus Woesearchaeota archaeon]|nr:putative toxin-antitoxin system toxin component, PIN family [Candidatus Woesearchaeota archaeon]